MADPFTTGASEIASTSLILSREQAEVKKAETARRIQREDRQDDLAERQVESGERRLEVELESLKIDNARRNLENDKFRNKVEGDIVRSIIRDSSGGGNLNRINRQLKEDRKSTGDRQGRLTPLQLIIGEKVVRTDRFNPENPDHIIAINKDPIAKQLFDRMQETGKSEDEIRFKNLIIFGTLDDTTIRTINLRTKSGVIGAFIDSSDEVKAQADIDFNGKKVEKKGSQSPLMQLINKVEKENPDFTPRQVIDEVIRVEQALSKPAKPSVAQERTSAIESSVSEANKVLKDNNIEGDIRTINLENHPVEVQTSINAIRRKLSGGQKISMTSKQEERLKNTVEIAEILRGVENLSTESTGFFTLFGLGIKKFSTEINEPDEERSIAKFEQFLGANLKIISGTAVSDNEFERTKKQFGDLKFENAISVLIKIQVAMEKSIVSTKSLADSMNNPLDAAVLVNPTLFKMRTTVKNIERVLEAARNGEIKTSKKDKKALKSKKSLKGKITTAVKAKVDAAKKIGNSIADKFERRQ